jgi:hypothetical protein
VASLPTLHITDPSLLNGARLCGTVVEAGHCDHGKDRSCREGKAAIVIKFPLLAYFGSIKYTSPIELFLIGKRERHLEH